MHVLCEPLIKLRMRATRGVEDVAVCDDTETRVTRRDTRVDW